MYDSEWNHLADCSYYTPGMRIAGVQHSGDVLQAPYPDGARETCGVNLAELREGFPGARYVVLAVYSYSRQKWDELDDASVFVANPHARGSGPGGMAVIGAARLTGAATTSIAGYLDLAPAGAPPEKPLGEPVFGTRRSPKAVDKKDGPEATPESDMRVHFVFTDQEVRIDHGGHHARGSTDAVGQMLSGVEKSRKNTGAQTLANAAAFQAALVCDRVHIVAQGVNHRAEDGGPAAVDPASPLVRVAGEGRFAFYERVAGALDEAEPTAPAAGKHAGGDSYPADVLVPPCPTTGGDGRGKGGEPGATAAARHTLFFGGDLDDWLEVTRHHGTRAKAKVGGPGGTSSSTLTLVNLRSAEKGWAKPDGAGVLKVNGATAYEELAQAVREARAGGRDA